MNAFLSNVYALSAPVYLFLALVIPILLFYVAIKMALAMGIVRGREYAKRIIGTALTFTAALLYAETHAIAVIFAIGFEALFGIDNVLGAAVLFGAYTLIDGFIDSAGRFAPKGKKEYKTTRGIIAVTCVAAIAALLLSILFLNTQYYDLFISLFGAIFIIFTVEIFITIGKIKRYLDALSREHLKWIALLLAVILFIGLVDVVIDVLDLPYYLNLATLPAVFAAFYCIHCVLQNIVGEKGRVGRRERW